MLNTSSLLIVFSKLVFLLLSSLYYLSIFDLVAFLGRILRLLLLFFLLVSLYNQFVGVNLL